MDVRGTIQEIEVVQRDHDRRINALEKNDLAIEGRQTSAESRLKVMEESLLEVKTTVIAESQKMREGYEKTSNKGRIKKRLPPETTRSRHKS